MRKGAWTTPSTPSTRRSRTRRSLACLALAGTLGVTRPVAAEAQSPEPSPWTLRGGVALGVVGTTYAAAWAFVSAAWWAGDTNPHLVFRNEGAFGMDSYAGGADKLGHFYSTYVATRMYSEIFEWGGFSRPAAMATSTLLTMAFFTAIELKDGYVPRYGFSAGDVVANTAGQAAALGLLLSPPLDEVMSIKLEYFPSFEYRQAVSRGENVNAPEDYSGQTVLLAFHLSALPAARRERAFRALRFVDVSLGYGTRGFQPVPRAPEPARQLLSLGLSLNFQRLFDELLDGRFGPRSTSSAIVHFANEVLQPPGTRIPLVTLERRRSPR